MSLTVEELGAFLAQPVPRDLPRGARQVALKGVLSLRALLVPLGIALFGALFVAVFFPFRALEELSLDLGKPAIAHGIVVSCASTNLSVNDRQVIRVRFAFPVPAKSAEAGATRTVEASCFTTSAAYRLGQTVEIEYRPDRPETARIRGCSLNAVGYAAALLGLIPLTGLVVAVVFWRMRRSRIRLLREGRFAQGRVVAVEATNVSVNDERRYRVQVRYDDGNGEREGFYSAYGIDVAEAERWKETGEPAGVLYRPERPDEIFLANRLLG